MADDLVPDTDDLVLLAADDLVLLASGRDADVFVVDSARVLRRYRAGGDVGAEAAVMGHLTACQFPVPRVYAARAAELLMERLDGPTMLQALRGGELGIDEGARTLADLHRGLHALPARLSPDSAVRILHLDLHPDNVMLTGRGPVLIDWRNAAEGPADLDVALSALILAEVAVDPTDDSARPAAALLAAFLRHVGGDPLSCLDQAVARRRGDPNRTRTELDRIATAAALVAAGR